MAKLMQMNRKETSDLGFFFFFHLSFYIKKLNKSLNRSIFSNVVSMQLMSNDKFKSVEHRVLAKSAGPRISVACFFTTHFQEFDKLYGPIKQLLTDESPALYKETFIKDYINSFYSAGLGEISALSQLRL